MKKNYLFTVFGISLFCLTPLIAQNNLETFSLEDIDIKKLNQFVRNETMTDGDAQKMDGESPFYLPSSPFSEFRLKTNKGVFDIKVQRNPQITFTNPELEDPYFTGKINGHEKSAVQMILTKDYFSMSIALKDSTENRQNGEAHEHNQNAEKITQIEIMHSRHMGDQTLIDLNHNKTQQGFIAYSLDELNHAHDIEDSETEESDMSCSESYANFCEATNVANDQKSLSSSPKIPTNYLGNRCIWVEAHPWTDYENVHGAGGAAHIANRLSKLFQYYADFSHVGTDICRTVFKLNQYVNIEIDYKSGSNSILHNWTYTGAANYFDNYIQSKLSTALNANNKDKIILGLTHEAYIDANNNKATRGQVEAIGGYKYNNSNRQGYTNTVDYHIPIHELYHLLGAVHSDADGWTCGSWSHFLNYGHVYAGHVHGTVMSYNDDYCSNMSWDTRDKVTDHLTAHLRNEPSEMYPDTITSAYSMAKSESFYTFGVNVNGGTEDFEGKKYNSSPHFTHRIYVPLGEGGNYRITLAGYFDTYLYVLDSNHHLVQKDDDGYPESYPLAPFEHRWSEIDDLLLYPGVYYIVVGGYNPSDIGLYELSIHGMDHPMYRLENNMVNDGVDIIETPANSIELTSSNREFDSELSRSLYSYEEFAREQLSKIEDPASYKGTDYGYSTKKSIDVDIVENEKKQLLKVFPNPASDQITIQLDTEEANTGFIEIIDPLGKSILTNEIKGQQKIELNISTWDSGQYYIKFLTTDKSLQSQASFIKWK